MCYNEYRRGRLVVKTHRLFGIKKAVFKNAFTGQRLFLARRFFNVEGHPTGPAALGGVAAIDGVLAPRPALKTPASLEQNLVISTEHQTGAQAERL